METDVKPTEGLPKPIVWLLFLVNIGLCSLVFLRGTGMEQLSVFGMYLLINLVLLPTVFVVVGLGLKLVNREFKLSNAYYLGLFMSIVFLILTVKT